MWPALEPKIQTEAYFPPDLLKEDIEGMYTFLYTATTFYACSSMHNTINPKVQYQAHFQRISNHCCIAALASHSRTPSPQFQANPPKDHRQQFYWSSRKSILILHCLSECGRSNAHFEMDVGNIICKWAKTYPCENSTPVLPLFWGTTKRLAES